ncbi:MAG TPA: phage tail protein [Thermoanaerobaculia bacterium]
MPGDVQDNVWPLPKFYFSVQLGDDTTVSFQEVDGLDSETQIIEYRHGNSPVFYPIKMPGLGKVSNVTMRKGIFVNDSKFWDWYNEIKMNTIARRTVIISLLDETGTPRRTWTLNNAWPTKITGTDLKSEGNEVAIESIEVAYETLTVASP